MKFAMAYSCGKDSTMAMKKMLDEGHELVAIIVSFSKNQDCSFFHGVKREFLEQYAETLGCELILCEIDSADNYDAIFTAGVRNVLEKVEVPNGMPISDEKLLELDPDIMLLPSWDYSKSKNMEEYRQAILNNPAYKKMKAIKTGRVYKIHDQYLYSMSQYSIKAIEEIFQVSYPELK